MRTWTTCCNGSWRYTSLFRRSLAHSLSVLTVVNLRRVSCENTVVIRMIEDQSKSVLPLEDLEILFKLNYFEYVTRTWGDIMPNCGQD